MNPALLALLGARVASGGGTDPLAAFSWAWRFESGSITGVADGASVTTWPDSSGNGRNATAVGTLGNVTLDADAFGATAGVKIALDGRLATAAITELSQPTTIWVVSNGLSIANSALVDGLVGTNRHLIYRSSNGASRMYAGIDVTLGTVTLATPGIVAARFNDASSRIWVNGGAAAESTSVGAQTLTGLVIGNANASLATNVTIGAVLVANASQSVADMNTIGRRLATTYGFTWTDITS